MTKLTIGNKEIEYDRDRETEIQPDLSEEMDTVSAKIAYYGELLGLAYEERVIADSKYRTWRAKYTIELVKNKSEHAKSEWKLKSKIESDDLFMAYKNGIAACEKNVKLLENMVHALREKSQNLRSKGANLRSEFESTGMNTKYTTNDKATEKMKRLRELKKRKGV